MAFPARFPRRCGLCDEGIREGDPELCVSDKDIIRMRPKGNR